MAACRIILRSLLMIWLPAACDVLLLHTDHMNWTKFLLMKRAWENGFCLKMSLFCLLLLASRCAFSHLFLFWILCISVSLALSIINKLPWYKIISVDMLYTLDVIYLRSLHIYKKPRRSSLHYLRGGTLLILTACRTNMSHALIELS